MLPQVNSEAASNTVIDQFSGLNTNKRIYDGYFSEIQNMSQEDYPLIRTSDAPVTILKVEDGDGDEVAVSIGDSVYPCHLYLTGIGLTECFVTIVEDEDNDCGKLLVYYTDDGSLKQYEPTITAGTFQYLENSKHTFITMGAQLVLFPEKILCNLYDVSTWTSLEVIYKYTDLASPAGRCVFIPCKADGTLYTTYLGESDTEPTTTTDGAVWIKTETVSGTVISREFYVYSSQTSSFAVADPYLFIAMGDLNGFSAGDVVEFDWSHITAAAFSGDSFPTGVDASDLQTELEALGTSAQIEAIKRNSVTAQGTAIALWGIVVPGLLSFRCRLSGFDTGYSDASISRTVPEFDYICEAENRLWSCRYGVQSGAIVNELYCCKLGDPTNWKVYAGLSTDSWAATCGIDGPFTGCVNYNGTPTFFKRDNIIKVYISSTGAHQTSSVSAPGGRCFADSGSRLYYNGVDGEIYTYDGSYPTRISSNIDKITAADMTIYNDRLFIASGLDDIITYSLENGVWCCQSAAACESISKYGDSLILKSGESLIYLAGDVPTVKESTTPTQSWRLVSGINYFGYSASSKYAYKYPASYYYVSRYDFRLKLEPGSEVKLYLQYDSSGTWELQGKLIGSRLGIYTIPVRPHRCDHFHYKLEGVGYAELWGITRKVEQGSDET